MPGAAFQDTPKSEVAPRLAAWINQAIAAAAPRHVPLLFLSGAQGSGKSTALRQAIGMLDMPVAGASIDDFYLPRDEREALAARVSPLLLTRGPPGTHDLALLRDTVDRLRGGTTGTDIEIPVFDKLSDDRAPRESWRHFSGRPAAIVIEGWLMGALPDAGAPDAAPLNAVEAEDTAGVWRRHQEEALAGPYAALWDQADSFCHILSPGFETVLDWRLEQEAGLWRAQGEAMPEGRPAWIARFIQHYERITRRMLSGGRRPGTEILIDAQRRIKPAYSS